MRMRARLWTHPQHACMSAHDATNDAGPCTEMPAVPMAACMTRHAGGLQAACDRQTPPTLIIGPFGDDARQVPYCTSTPHMHFTHKASKDAG